MFNSYFHCNLSYCFESTASVKLLNEKIQRFLFCNTFLLIKIKRLFISSQGFSSLEKNAVIRSQRAKLPIQSGVTALCRL
jgi:hypothetical protein